ncbi:MAG: NAD-dependent epimerase/dehydratase family protein [Bacteroidota bacterium]
MDFLNNKSIIVTGGAGFIGSTLVKSLVAKGAKVKVIDNLWRGKLENLMVDGKYIIDIENDFFLADVMDYSKCLELIKDADYVYHLADIVAGINYVFGNELFIYRQNVIINSNVLSACVINKIPNYIYVGTACSFPKHLQMVDNIAYLKEDQTYPAEPESSYGWSKLMGEYEAELAMKSGKINVGLLRFHNVYGPFASYEPNRSQVIPSLIRKAVTYSGDDFVVWGSGEQYRDFIYVDDVINALLLVAEKGMNKGLIQIGTGLPISIKQVAEKVVELSGKKIQIKYDLSAPEGDRGRVSAGTRASDLLNWHPETSYDEGMKNTYNWVSSQINKKD